MASILDFEKACGRLKHGKCLCCHTVSLKMKVSRKGLCEKCSRLKDPGYYLKRKQLPVWWKDGTAMFSLPPELIGLSDAEKMLIQRISPFVPLHHIKQGTMGLSGHVCAFEQDIGDFVKRLPRHQTDVSMLKVIKQLKTEIGDGKDVHTRTFRVRKSKVLSALLFLKKHNPLYHDIEIDMSALDWMGSAEEATLMGHEIVTDSIETSNDHTHQNSDMGPAPAQAVEPTKEGDNVAMYGYLETGGTAGSIAETDASVNDQLQDAVARSTKKKEITVDWPAVAGVPVSEYGDTRIFALAFPWLFPGGEGDVKEAEEGQEAAWGKRMLYYEDGRFASDKVFSFFAMNYIVRHRNSSSGRWFVDSFQNNCPETLEELAKEIEGGNTSFINSLTYYSKRIKGSTSYWLQKRSELYSWINHHVEAGHGAPLFFMTLSCAEHFWPDVSALLKERLDIAGLDSSECFVGSPKMPQLVNDYAIVIQEYFQERVKTWLETVGKDVFGIEHYWVRYEFAPGRGQIHAHLLAITKDQTIQELCYAEKKSNAGEEAQATLLADWASKAFGLTASVENGFDDLNINKNNTPVRVRFTDVCKTAEERHDDIQKLMKHVQVHQCSDFCLRKAKEKR